MYRAMYAHIMSGNDVFTKDWMQKNLLDFLFYLFFFFSAFFFLQKIAGVSKVVN